MSTASRIALILITISLAGLSSRNALAQAWVGPKGGLNVSLDYSYGSSNRVIEDYDTPVADTDDISNHTIALSGEYTPIDKLAFQVTVPIVSSKYTGTSGFPLHGRYDDGSLHTTLQDLRLVGRYMVLDGPVAFSPYLGASIPMVDYETVGFAGAGRGLKQLHIGANVGKFFVSGVPNLYLHGSYEFSLVERYETGFPETAEYGQNKSDIKALVGYFITDKIDVNLAADVRVPHGGLHFLTWIEDPEGTPDVVEWYHDALLAEGFWLLGGGVSYQATEALRVSAFFRLFVRGHETRDTNMVGLGLGWDVL